MGLKVFSFLFLQCWVLLVLSLGVQSDGSEVALELLRTPHAFSNRNFANFGFQVLVGGNGSICTDCSTNCKKGLTHRGNSYRDQLDQTNHTASANTYQKRSGRPASPIDEGDAVAQIWSGRPASPGSEGDASPRYDGGGVAFASMGDGEGDRRPRPTPTHPLPFPRSGRPTSPRDEGDRRRRKRGRRVTQIRWAAASPSLPWATATVALAPPHPTPLPFPRSGRPASPRDEGDAVAQIWSGRPASPSTARATAVALVALGDRRPQRRGQPPPLPPVP
ncbi:UNVERIFIED_CONTAM: hypothetical protein Scaly_1812900 [Sesamum calycinum]|uniref:Uncharacterized protein n=1 Tax=Sesamum calycinum TaxID=2727403 RepID=A0AAW2NE59_9LAMI